MNRADLYNTFPDDLKQAIRAYEPLEGKTTEQLHNILLMLRLRFDLSPWHPLTFFIKSYARGCMTGKPSAVENQWISYGWKNSTYKEKVPRWANLLIHVHLTDSTVIDTHVAVQPTNGKLWSYKTEKEISYVAVKHPAKHRGGINKLSTGWVITHAAQAIKDNPNKHNQVEIDYVVGDEGNQIYRHKHIRKRSVRKKNTTDKKEAPQVVEPVQYKDRAEVVNVAAMTGTVTEADKEVLLTMLEMASLKLKELGMCSTLSRWRATIRRLTQTNETDKTQTQTAAETD